MNASLSQFRTLVKLYALQADVTQLTADTDAQMDPVIDSLIANSLKKVKTTMKLLINQSSTAAPTITATFENTTGILTSALTLARTGAGVYTIAGLTTTANKNKTLIRVSVGGVAGGDVSAQVVASDKIQLSSFSAAGTAADGVIVDTFLEVDLYV